MSCHITVTLLQTLGLKQQKFCLMIHVNQRQQGLRSSFSLGDGGHRITLISNVTDWYTRGLGVFYRWFQVRRDRSLPFPAVPAIWAYPTFREILTSGTNTFHALSPRTLKLLWASTIHDSIDVHYYKTCALEEIAENYSPLPMSFIWVLYSTHGSTEVPCHDHLCQALRYGTHLVFIASLQEVRRCWLTELYLSINHCSWITVAVWQSSGLHANLFKSVH